MSQVSNPTFIMIEDFNRLSEKEDRVPVIVVVLSIISLSIFFSLFNEDDSFHFVLLMVFLLSPWAIVGIFYTRPLESEIKSKYDLSRLDFAKLRIEYNQFTNFKADKYLDYLSEEERYELFQQQKTKSPVEQTDLDKKRRTFFAGQLVMCEYEVEFENIVYGNLDLIEYGLKPIGRQVQLNVGIIDILAKDSKDQQVIIELKRDRAGDKVVGQIARYMGELGKSGPVRGMIVASSFDDKIESAVRMIPNLQLISYADIISFDHSNR